MKSIYFFIFINIANFNSLFAQTNQTFFNEANQFFKTYVKDGKVDYSAIKLVGNFQLGSLINIIATHNYSQNEEKAYLINAYNLLVINEVVNAYPIQSPNDIEGMFDNKNSILNHKMVSLNEIENDILRKKYKDTNLHFVLVCAGLGCPPITNFAYTPNELNNQIKKQTNVALNNNKFVYQNKNEKTIYLSEIFNWYANDFGKNKKEIITYINSYRNDNFNENFKVKYYAYDWTLNNTAFFKINTTDTMQVEKLESPCLNNNNSNLNTTVAGQTYNAGSLLRKNQFDYTLFNTLYTQTKSNWLGTNYTGNRETFNTHLLQITYGISKNKRFNIGLDINFKSSGKSSDSTINGIKNAFIYHNTDSSRVGITSVGFRAKFQPFKTVSNFTIQSTLLGPTIKYPEGKANDINGSALYWADWDRITWWNQLFYTKTFGKFQLFTELDFLFRIKAHKNQIGMLDMPASVFLSYFPTKKTTFYAMTQHVPRFTNNINPQNSNDWVIPSNYTASGLGFKYQISRGLNIELLYTNFWRSTNAGLGSTFNFGIKYITK